MELIRCENVNKFVEEGENQLQILKNVSFTMNKGEMVAIVGSSGSGKSTLLHALGGLDCISSGDILFQGKSIKAMNSNEIAKVRNEKMGFIYQFHHLMADFSALENAMMPMLIGGKSKKEAKEQAEYFLNIVGLSHRLKHFPSMLSGGERQRVAIARALVNRPDIVMADEPTGNLDFKTTNDIFNLIQKLNAEHGMGFLLVTHDRDLADKMNRKLVMKDGVLTEE